MIIKNTNINSNILSSANSRQTTDRQGKFKYFAKKEFIEDYKYHILNTKKAFELNKLVIFDFDFPCFNQNSPRFEDFQELEIVKEVIKLIHEQKICYSTSPNGIKIYLVVKDENILERLNKTYLASNSLKWQLQTTEGEIKEKECNIEVLHLLSHHCDFAFCNDLENTYYQVFNASNLFKEYDIATIKSFFDCLFTLEAKTTKRDEKALSQNNKSSDDSVVSSGVFNNFHKFVNRKTRKYRDKSTKKFIQELVKEPSNFYKYLIEFDDKTYIIESSKASNAITAITPFFYRSDKPTFDKFIDYIESEIYPNIRGCDFFYRKNIPDKMEIERYINEEGEEVALIGEDDKFRKLLIKKNDLGEYEKVIFKNDKSLKEYCQNNLQIGLDETYIKENKNNKIIEICDKRIKEVIGKTKDLESNIRKNYFGYTHFYNTYSQKEFTKMLIKDWQNNPAQFEGKGNIENYPRLKALLENIFLDNPFDLNMIIQAGHFVFDMKPQFANIWSDEGGTGKDIYQKLKRLIYDETYIKTSEIANDFLPSNIDEKTLIYHSEFVTKRDELDKFKDMITSDERMINIKGKDPRKLDTSKVMYEYTTNNILSITHKNFDFALARRINFIYSTNRQQLGDIEIFKDFDFSNESVDLQDLALDLANFFYGIVFDYCGGDYSKFLIYFKNACNELVKNNLDKFKMLENETKEDEIENNELCQNIAESFKAPITQDKREEILSTLETFNLKDTPIYKAFENREKFVFWKDLKRAFDTISKPYLKTKEGKNVYFAITGKEKKIGTQRFTLSFV